jgi:hypothetical protein
MASAKNFIKHGSLSKGKILKIRKFLTEATGITRAI